MFFFFKKSKSKRKRNRTNSSSKTKKGSLTYEQLAAISDSIIRKKRLVVYAETL